MEAQDHTVDIITKILRLPGLVVLHIFPTLDLYFKLFVLPLINKKIRKFITLPLRERHFTNYVNTDLVYFAFVLSPF